MRASAVKGATWSDTRIHIILTMISCVVRLQCGADSDSAGGSVLGAPSEKTLNKSATGVSRSADVLTGNAYLILLASLLAAAFA